MASEVQVLTWPDGTLCIHEDGECVSDIEPEWHAALLDALLRERGMKRVWAIHEDGFHYHRCANKALAERKAESRRQHSGIASRVEQIYVPVQGEGE